MYALWGITVLMVIFHGRFKISFLFTWFLFLGVVIGESLSRPFAVVYDLSVILCGTLFCILVKGCEVSWDRILRCLIICGFIISISVILDSSLGIIKKYFINVYTVEARSVKLGMRRSGGLLPHTGSAGGYIYTGLAAYIAYTIIKGKRINRLSCWLTIAIFGLSALMIAKRGFILDTILAFFFVKILQIRTKDLLVFNVRKQLKGIAYVLLVVLILIGLYNWVDIVRESIDSVIEKFKSEDGSYSGRADLYLLAFTLFRGHYLKGIGWGKFRKNTYGFFGIAGASYAAHNVYIQLLCETGILGLTAFLAAALSSLFHAVKKYRGILQAGTQGADKTVMELGIFMQVFFLTYCMSGNCLYDYNFCITYFIGILLTVISVPKGAK